MTEPKRWTLAAAREFAEGYAQRSDVTAEWLHENGRFPFPCECGEPDCSGWMMASGETVLDEVMLGRWRPASDFDRLRDERDWLLRQRDRNGVEIENENLRRVAGVLADALRRSLDLADPHGDEQIEAALAVFDTLTEGEDR